MTREHYNQIAGYITARPFLHKLVRMLSWCLPAVMYTAYPLLLAFLAATRDARFLRVLLVPAAVFILVTVLRKLLNRPRPYEKFSITPLVAREGAGESMPSRHASSAAVIAAVFCFIWMPVGIVMSLIALMIAVIRLLTGVHFLRDVIAGVIIGLALGVIGFWIIL